MARITVEQAVEDIRQGKMVILVEVSQFARAFTKYLVYSK